VDEPIRIGVVYPWLLGTYGDRGNAEVLAWRLARRGHAAEVVDVPAPEAVPAGLDAYMLGGGEDMNQAAAAKLLLGRAGRGLLDALGHGAPALAVCGSLQLLGEVYTDNTGGQVPGLRVLDLETVSRPPRCVGEVVARLPDGSLLTGFENHGGRTQLGATARPLAEVVGGNGNNGEDGTEGARLGNLFATYLHGPVLARNPHLADAMARAVLERRGSSAESMEEIDEDPGDRLHSARLRAVGFDPRSGRRASPMATWMRRRRRSDARNAPA
jgi:lipid II isoglutaminyl synthase (glutamine-hydrolysing)